MRLLIADDDPNTVNLLRKYLMLWNYEVVAVSNGSEAIEIINGNDPPQLIVLDWLMPDINGIEVIKKVRLRDSANPPYIILFTVRDEKGAIIEGLEAGANDYITKPFDKDEFRARIRVGERVVQLQNSLSDRIRQLQEAVSQIKSLRGIIPICSYCHKIRNDQKSWQQLEKYISEHSGAEFSHGICPECLKKHYPEESE
ncbi:MAG: response regulator transcription factor [Syntrophaceae bacterium]|jgi:phosphoserine phosphatase RsbU/P|nr:response regulator transcription factor [Syntrophaceae bacterium]HOC59519.1 response regulator transcription factor [Smithellaceae bacterium]HQM45167.1 response regulator transcription factor [Smithellaceae bacterium]